MTKPQTATGKQDRSKRNKLSETENNLAAKMLMARPDSSDWLKMIIATGCRRDPLDVINDLESALEVFNARFASLVAAH